MHKPKKPKAFCRKRGFLRMAIYHCHVDCYRKAEGKSAVGGLSYRRGIKTKCGATGKHFDFRKKKEAIYSEFINADCDNRKHDLASIKKIFEEVERAEKHPRGTLGREIECGLPHELTTEQQIKLSKTFISKIKERAKAENAFFDFSIHSKDGNNHVHIAMSERELEKKGEGFKLSKTKRRDWHEKDFVFMARKIWETEINIALEEAGINQRMDCRTLAQQGIKKIPTIHEGKSRHIKNGERKMINQEIEKRNALLIAPINEAEIIDISSFYTEKVEYGTMTNADEKDSKNVKLYQYRLAEGKYKNFEIVGLTFVNMKHPSYVSLYFEDKSILTDKGTTITANNGTPTANATRMVDLARLKGWKSIKFTGSPAFVREAMAQAHFMGLEVIAEGEEQIQIFESIKAETNTLANGISKAVNAPTVRQVSGAVPNPNEPAFQKHATTPAGIPNLASISKTLQQSQQAPQKPKQPPFVADGLTHSERHAQRFAEKQALKNNSITVNSDEKNETQALTPDNPTKRIKL